MTSPAVIAARVAILARQLGHPPEKVLEERALAEASGVPQYTVASLLAGRRPPPSDPEKRFVRRMAVLRDTRRKANGRMYTHEEIAEGAHMSRQQCSALLAGERRPKARHQFDLERFFQVPDGFLTATDTAALRRCLLDIELSLLRELFERHRTGDAREPRGATGPREPRGAKGPSEPEGAVRSPSAATEKPPCLCPPLPAPAERRHRREALGLRLAEVAASVGVGVDEVRAWEEGRQEPDGAVRVRYAAYLRAASGLAGLSGAP
ncbi:helix-turn-helix domain-containing protein [Streptomyces poonensis]|uniref:helix-turn-helix domain-containing protein n=1 Tax=Streptomyces poonensis TaxID=68255 RepID=UPI001E5909AD|nr:helix-turn-helix transcriptional regulator [Streptomyces poonensis]